jgi:hypothetical protein
MPMDYYRDQFHHVVFYREDKIMADSDPSFMFLCWAEDEDHAEEQLLNAQPDAIMVLVVKTDDVLHARWVLKQRGGH